MVEPQIRYVRTVDGVNIAYFAMGEGLPYVLINFPFSNVQHELATRSRRRRIERTARQALLVRYDHRDQGISDKWPHAPTTADYVRDLEAVVDKLELRLFILVATYAAAYPIAFAYAGAHPERVLALVALVGGLASDFTVALADMPGADWRFMSDALARRLVGPDEPAAAENLAEDLRASTNLEGLRRMNDWYAYARREADAEAVQARSLLLPAPAGDDSLAEARALAARMPNAVVRPVGGETNAARSAEIANAIQAFLTGRESSDAVDVPAPVAASGGSAVILFTDIVDSTALTERMGDAAYRALSRSVDQRVRAAMHERGGMVVEGKVLGDGVMGVFTSASQAIGAARACVEIGQELPMHVGLHAGDVTHEAGNVFGGAVNIASRICGLSAPGEILVSDVVRGMARSSAGVVFEDRGEQEMKGVGEAVRVYRVVDS